MKLPYKVHNPAGVHVADCKHVEEAACLVAFLGDDASIRVGPLVVWHEGKEDQPAGESYDQVAQTVHDRMEVALERVRSR